MGVVIGYLAVLDWSGKRQGARIDGGSEHMIDSGIDFSGHRRFGSNGFVDTAEETSLEGSPRPP